MLIVYDLWVWRVHREVLGLWGTIGDLDHLRDARTDPQQSWERRPKNKCVWIEANLCPNFPPLWSLHSTGSNSYPVSPNESREASNSVACPSSVSIVGLRFKFWHLVCFLGSNRTLASNSKFTANLYSLIVFGIVNGKPTCQRSHDHYRSPVHPVRGLGHRSPKRHSQHSDLAKSSPPLSYWWTSFLSSSLSLWAAPSKLDSGLATWLSVLRR